MKKTLYVHIGRPKVGSTAIQRFLKFNRQLLLENGVLYPVAGEQENASHLLAEALSSRGAEETRARAGELFAALADEWAATDAAKAIISSENFYFLEPRTLAEHLPSDVDIKIVCYIRRQDEVLVSSYIQEAKDGSLPREEEQDLSLYLKNKERMRLLDYEHMLGLWSAVFGQSNVIVRVYESGQLKDSLFDDILDVLGLPMVPEYRLPPQRVNPTPASDVLELIKIVNGHDVPHFLKRQLKSRLVEISETLDYDINFDAKQVFSQEYRQIALQRFETSNAAVARDYLGRSDGVLFRATGLHDNAPAAESGAPDERYSVDRLAHIGVGMLVAQQQRINSLERKLQRMIDELMAYAEK